MDDNLTATQLINQQLQQMKQLEDLLMLEREVLQQKSPDDLTQVTEQKNTLLLNIQSLDQQISQNIQFREEKKAGLHAEILSDIESTLLRCKEKNDINGQIIHQSALAVERMKTSLLAKHTKSSMTYDNKGKTSGGLSSLGIKA